MAVLLDIDVDFMFQPRTAGNVFARQTLWISPTELLRLLRKAGLSWENADIVAFTDHKEAYFTWKEKQIHGGTLVHVDCHSDLSDGFPWVVHCGNYLQKAVAERMFTRVIWVVPDWLYDSGDWARFDLSLKGGPGYVASRFLGSRGEHTQPGAVRLAVDRKTLLEVVPLNRFVMPNTGALVVTVATSPLFIPEGTGAHRELLEQFLPKLSVRPNVPFCLSRPRLRRLLGEGCGDHREILRGSAGLSYLMEEHRVIREEARNGNWGITA